jgi:ribosomal-protein-alanine N-acetyltransferase
LVGIGAGVLVRVRLGIEGDLAGVLRLERAAVGAPHWAEAEYRRVIEDVGGGEASGETQRVRRSLWVVEAEGWLVGFAVGKVGPGRDGLVGELESVAVAAEQRRRGVGRALCEAVIVWCRGLGAARIELEVRAQGVAAIALYEALGFRVVGRRRGYYREPADDAVLMERELEG